MVLIDQGFSGKQLELRLARMDVKPSEIDGILITIITLTMEGVLELQKKRGVYQFFVTIGLLLL